MAILKNVRAAVRARDKRTCQYCGKGKLQSNQLHIDHIIPEADGGSDEMSNLVVACKHCNLRKHKKSFDEYYKDRLAQIQREQHYLSELSERLKLNPPTRKSDIKFY